MLTPFGRAVRKHRIDAHVSLREMAQRMGIAPSFLSAVENGRKSIPEGFSDRASLALGLDLAQHAELKSYADRSQNEYTISTHSRSDMDRELVSVFARQFGGLNEQEKEEIMSILKGEKNE